MVTGHWPLPLLRPGRTGAWQSFWDVRDSPAPPAAQVSEEVITGRLALVMVAEVKQLLDNKWHQFAKPIFQRKLWRALLLQSMYAGHAIIPHHYRLEPGNLTEYPWHNGFIICAEVLVLVCVVGKLAVEVWKVVIKRWAYITATHGAATLEKVLGILFCLFYLAAMGFRLTGLSVVEVSPPSDGTAVPRAGRSTDVGWPVINSNYYSASALLRSRRAEVRQ